MTVEGVQETLYHDGGYTRSDPINCAPKPRWFSSAAAIQTSITSAFTPGALEITLQPVGGLFISSPGDSTFIFTVEAGPQVTSWQWYKSGGEIIPGAITDTLTITDVDETDTDSYYVEVSNGGPEMNSAEAYLVVTVCPIAFNDDFDGNDDDPPDSGRWTYHQATIQDNELYLNVNPGSLAWARSIYELHEDFSVTVDFELNTPTSTQDAWNVILECWADADDYMYVAIVGGDTPSQIYSVVRATNSNRRTIFSPWGYTVGKLRLVRRGYTIECWAWNVDDGWTMTTSWTGNSGNQVCTDPVPVKLRAQTFAPYNPVQNVKFNNLIVEGSCAIEPYLGEFTSTAPIVTDINDAELFSPIYSDSFEGVNGTQPANWTVVANDGGSASIDNNTVRFISSGAEDAEYKVNNFYLEGDFDFAFNYGWNTLNDSTWASYIRVGGSTAANGYIMIITLYNYDWLTVDPIYAYHTRSDANNGGSTWNVATGQTGKMRIKRIGTQQFSYFWDAGTNGWVLCARCPMTINAGDFTPRFSFHSDTITANVDAWIYNFQVYSADNLVSI
jgi:hypothetical protein